MAGDLLSDISLVVCDHGGRALPISAATRVRVLGRPVIVQSTAYAITDCPLPVAGGGPCASGGFITFARRLTASGAPVVLDSSQGVCAPTAAALRVVLAQDRVKGQ